MSKCKSILKLLEVPQNYSAYCLYQWFDFSLTIDAWSAFTECSFYTHLENAEGLDRETEKKYM